MPTSVIDNASTKFARLSAAAEALFERVKHQRWFTRLLQVLRIVIPLALIGYLGSALMGLGLSEIGRSLPTSWLFYMLIPISYLMIPVGDVLIYRHLWGTNRLPLSVLLRKCFMNGHLVDLSGEAYLFIWAKRNLQLSDRFILHSIKDNCLLGANGSMSVLFALLLGLAGSGHWMMSFIPNGMIWIGVAVAAAPLMLILVFAISRKKILVLGAQQVAFVLVAHAGRCALSYALIITMWSAALPSVPLAVWLNFLAIKSLVNRFSFIPNGGLLVLTAGIGVAGALGMPVAGVAAVLLTVTAGDYLMHLLLVGLPALAGGARDFNLARQTG